MLNARKLTCEISIIAIKKFESGKIVKHFKPIEECAELATTDKKIPCASYAGDLVSKVLCLF
jgi:hypothetical protein